MKNVTLQRATAFKILLIPFLLAILLTWYATREFIKYQDELAVNTANISVPKAGYAWIEIDFGDNRKRIFEGQVRDASYSFPEVIEAITQANRVTMQIGKSGIVEIDGVRGKWTVYDKRGEKIPSPLEELIVSGGAKYTLRLEK